MKKVTLAIALVGTIFLTSGSIIFAGNNTDTKFDFYFTTPNNVRTTEARPKHDTTSSYVKINSGKNLNLGVSMKMVGGKWNGSHYEDVGSSTKLSTDRVQQRYHSTQKNGAKVVQDYKELV